MFTDDNHFFDIKEDHIEPIKVGISEEELKALQEVPGAYKGQPRLKCNKEDFLITIVK
jgi:hypothetical protein